MGWLTAAGQVVAALFKWLSGRQDLANDPAMKKNKSAQQDQAQTDRIERLVRTATRDPDPKKAAAAAAELRQMNSE